MKHVVSVSLGSSSRDVDQVVTLLGQEVRIERRGVDGDTRRAEALVRELDGKVDAFGLGGMDLFVYAGGRRYPIRDAVNLAKHAIKTPMVCGAGLKDTLERRSVEQLEPELHWSGKRVLMTPAVDRFGMAEALDAAGAKVLYGDLIFALGLPVPLYRLDSVRRLARLVLPVLLKLPFSWIYPTGSKQEAEQKNDFARYYDWADVIAGDWHYIKRYAPARLDDKVIFTNTTTGKDVELLRDKGARLLITTTPRFGGRSLPTNLLEAAFIAVSGKYSLTSDDYHALLTEANLRPNVIELQDLVTG